jgi:hypothetical protein
MNRIILITIAAACSASSALAQQAAPSAKMNECIAREQARNGSSKGMATTTCTEYFAGRGEPQADSSATPVARGSTAGSTPNATTATPAQPATPAASQATPAYPAHPDFPRNNGAETDRLTGTGIARDVGQWPCAGRWRSRSLTVAAEGSGEVLA